MPESRNGSRVTGDMPAVRDDFNINHPDEEWNRHQGEHVAWSRDGRRVVASADDMKALFEAVDRLGLPSDEYVVGYIPRDDEICIGGGFYCRVVGDAVIGPAGDSGAK